MWLTAGVLGLAGPALAAPGACDALPWQPLAPGLWLLPAPASESDAANRGHSSHLLVARDGARTWAIGTGATPRLGKRLRCTVQRHLGRVPTDAWVPWAHAELALGSSGLQAARLWAHERVAQAMAEQCATCVERLRLRLGDAAVDLGPDPVRLPTHRLRGEHGRLGPFDWWVLPRAEGRVVTLLRHRGSGVMVAHGLLWGDGPPDLRDAELPLLQMALDRLSAWPGSPGRWVGESGPLLDAGGVQAQAQYLARLRAEAADGVRRGDLGTEAPRWSAPPGTGHARHHLNWQRAWRHAEDDWLRQAR